MGRSVMSLCQTWFLNCTKRTKLYRDRLACRVGGGNTGSTAQARLIDWVLRGRRPRARAQATSTGTERSWNRPCRDGRTVRSENLKGVQR